jgi:ankyrin repeat protein
MSEELIGEFIDAAVRDQKHAAKLLQAHPDLINARWLHSETVLHFLAVERFPDAVRFLAERGADVNLVDAFGDAPLIHVAFLGHTEIVEILLSHGANANATSTTHNNPLHCAVERAHEDIVALLLAAGADPRYRSDLDETIFDVVPFSGPERERMLAVLATYGLIPDED